MRALLVGSMVTAQWRTSYCRRRSLREWVAAASYVQDRDKSCYDASAFVRGVPAVFFPRRLAFTGIARRSRVFMFYPASRVS
ncbi:uncharacterized protein PHACADRAFT_256623 [Phanerochaete carnosa HHB-10118-sp]|uniref:Uncharacterized protein n=1 Tax=Phanerochaete carnosa (strain HHB-10118-sp) TaxID=650164 RepID=K5W9X3_PHACS|nr:uncharacterized protein PHACADRAFT_256623 [Phanerochaete carnosa HHB-10118-sp]EKM55764.1 hypothetical protein PHACADRAFT_256623 [Phanerochaete carnosa HHB-10118-sp]